MMLRLPSSSRPRRPRRSSSVRSCATPARPVLTSLNRAVVETPATTTSDSSSDSSSDDESPAAAPVASKKRKADSSSSSSSSSDSSSDEASAPVVVVKKAKKAKLDPTTIALPTTPLAAVVAMEVSSASEEVSGYDSAAASGSGYDTPMKKARVTNAPFRRVKAEDVVFADPRLMDNSFNARVSLFSSNGVCRSRELTASLGCSRLG